MKCIGIGRLTRDPEIRYSTDGNTTIATLTLACDRKFKKEGQPTADFISCVAFNKTAQFIEKYFKKGMKVYVEGVWQTDSFDDKETGKKVYTNKLFIEAVDFCESKGSSDSANKEGATPSTAGDGFMNLPSGIDEELPFV